MGRNEGGEGKGTEGKGGGWMKRENQMGGVGMILVHTLSCQLDVGSIYDRQMIIHEVGRLREAKGIGEEKVGEEVG